MEQKTEASQAVDELLPCPFCGAAARIESNRDWHKLRADHDESCVFDPDDYDLMYPAQLGYLLEIVQVWNRRAALKVQPAPTEAPNFCAICGKRLHAGSIHTCTPPDVTEAMPKLVIALSDYEQRRLVIASDEMIDGERVVCAAIKSAPTETQDGFQFEVVAAQGEDSARLVWKRITAPGQVKVGDKLRFTIGNEKFSERVKQIINPGYPDEELIYNKRRNFYVITSNAITNFGSSKNVEFLARASAETGGVKP